MKLNPREKLMLIALSIIIVVAGSYFLLIKPQLDQIDDLKIEKDELEVRIDEINAELSQGSQLDSLTELLDAAIIELMKEFYPEILKDKILIIINDMIELTEVNNDILTFNKVTIENIRGVSTSQRAAATYVMSDLAGKYIELHPPEDGTAEEEEIIEEEVILPVVSIEARKIEAMTVRFNLAGTYEQLVDFIKEIEALERTTVITNFMIVSSNEEDEEELLADLEVLFYAIPKIYEQDEEYYEWEYENEYGREDPFEVIEQ